MIVFFTVVSAIRGSSSDTDETLLHSGQDVCHDRRYYSILEFVSAQYNDFCLWQDYNYTTLMDMTNITNSHQPEKANISYRKIIWPNQVHIFIRPCNCMTRRARRLTLISTYGLTREVWRAVYFNNKIEVICFEIKLPLKILNLRWIKL